MARQSKPRGGLFKSKIRDKGRRDPSQGAERQNHSEHKRLTEWT